MLLKYLLVSAGMTMFVVAAGVLSYDLYLLLAHRRACLDPLGETQPAERAPAVRWRASIALTILAWAPLLISAAIVFVPSGMAGARVSLTQGTPSDTLDPGVHFRQSDDAGEKKPQQ
jgi:hypothetical protein